MKCELRIISGARAGHRDVYDKSYIGIGRHPLSDVRFDAEQDLDASTRHAALVKNGDAWVLRDLGSTNGTFVNGEKLAGERALSDGDILKFGVHGPEVSFHVIKEDDEAGEVVMAAVQAPKVAPTKPEGLPVIGGASGTGGAGRSRTGEDRMPTEPIKAAPPPPSKTSVLRAEITHQQSRARWLALALFILVIGALGVVYWQGKTSGEVIADRDQRVDSLIGELATLRALQAQTEAMKTLLQDSLRAEPDPVRRTAITNRIETVERRSEAIQQAQGMNFNAIQNANDPAVAVIYVKFQDTTKMFSGTAFSVNAQGVMLTNKHNVVGEDGGPPREIAVQFSGSQEVHPARLVRTSPNSDLAVLQLESQGPFPAIAGFSEGQTAEGASIVMLGFPGGGVRATLVSGSVTRVIPDSLYELDSFSGVGASGSPILDRDGKVIGIVFGGLVGSGGRAVVGLPISRAREILR